MISKIAGKGLLLLTIFLTSHLSGRHCGFILSDAEGPEPQSHFVERVAPPSPSERAGVRSDTIAPLINTQNKYTWADSVFNTLTPEERIAQLFMVAAFSNKDKKHQENIASLVRDYKIGGLIFFQGGPVREAKLTNYYQSLAKVPLLISIDGEWGLAMRLDSTFKFPRQMTLGAVSNDSLIFQMGVEIARHCKRIGIHVNFAPVIDVNNNPGNPVISNRSFGENKYKVAEKGYMYMAGMQQEHVMATGKHFPGHGDTDSDSHLTLPIINHDTTRIDSLELYPFKQLFHEGLMSIMVAHLFIPALDSTTNQASTLSRNIVTKMLKDDLGYKGLIFTDALNMKGVAKFYDPGIVDVKALLAGNDVLLNAEDVPKAIEQIKEAIYQQQISQEEIDRRCMKILRAKEWCGLQNIKPINTKNIYEDLNTSASLLINREIIKESLTLLKNDKDLIPLKDLDTLKIACVAINEKNENLFQQTLSYYANVKHFNVGKRTSIAEQDSLLKELANYNTIIVGVFNVQSKPENNFGMPDYTAALIDTIQKSNRSVVCLFGNPYALAKFRNPSQGNTFIECYEDNNNTQSLAAQTIFGTCTTNGHLPVTVGGFKGGDGQKINQVADRMSFVLPEEIGISSAKLKGVDSLVNKAIKNKAMPGCQVLAAKNGKVFYYKSFGKHTYEGKREVNNLDLYDLASVTKIAGSAMAIMKLKEQGKIDLDKSLSYYLPELDSTNKKDIIIREMLAHQSGLQSWIPFWKNTVIGDSLRDTIFSTIPTDTFKIRVAENMYERYDYIDTMYAQIYRSDLGPKEYKYSDLGYYLMKKIIERVTQQSLDTFLYTNFYKPMGIWSMTYNPRNYYDLDKIVPTEFDKYFRHQLLQGDVHDQGAAMMGGVAGHAGLFSNAVHLATLMQMLLNGGTYAGKQYLDPATIKEFTCNWFYPLNKNRRGLCFDKPEPDPKKESPTAESAGINSYGHSGFTGTYTWVDPDNGFVYVFLSNRVHPDAENKKLTQSGLRTNIQELFYKAMK